MAASSSEQLSSNVPARSSQNFQQHSSLSESPKFSGVFNSSPVLVTSHHNLALDTVPIPPNQDVVTRSATSLYMCTLTYIQALPEKIITVTFQSFSCPLTSAPHLSTKQSGHNYSRLTSSKNYWVIKSDPRVRVVNGIDVGYSLSKLISQPGETTVWQGVRYFVSRTHIKDMKTGDMAFFYHSNCKQPGVVGIVKIIKGAYADPSQFDVASPYYDPKSTEKKPLWFSVNIKFVHQFCRTILLTELRTS